MKHTLIAFGLCMATVLGLYIWAVKRGFEDDDQDPHSFI